MRKARGKGSSAEFRGKILAQRGNTVKRWRVRIGPGRAFSGRDRGSKQS